MKNTKNMMVLHDQKQKIEIQHEINNKNNKNQAVSDVDKSENQVIRQQYHLSPEQAQLLSMSQSSCKRNNQNILESLHKISPRVQSNTNIMDQFCNSTHISNKYQNQFQQTRQHQHKQEQDKFKQKPEYIDYNKNIDNLQYKLLKTRRSWLRQKMKNITQMVDCQLPFSHINDNRLIDRQFQHKNITDTNENSMVKQQIVEKVAKFNKISCKYIKQQKQCYQIKYPPPKPGKKNSVPLSKSTQKQSIHIKKFLQSQTQSQRYKQREIKSTIASRKNSSGFSSSASAKYGKYNQIAQLQQRIYNSRQAHKIGKIRRLRNSSFVSSQLTQTQPIILLLAEQQSKNKKHNQKLKQSLVGISNQEQNSNQDVKIQKNKTQSNSLSNTFYKKTHKNKKIRIKVLSTEPQEEQIDLQKSSQDIPHLRIAGTNNQNPQIQTRPLNQLMFQYQPATQLDIQQIHYYLVREIHRLRAYSSK